MSPRTGRPKSENPRDQQITVRVTKEDYEAIEEARNKDRKPENSMSAWASRKLAELAKKLTK